MLKKLIPELTDEGVGAKARRLIPYHGEHLDPFVIFDEYQVTPDAHFPTHPHGGFEGFQFLMGGATEYQDNLGNKGLIKKGEMRRFVAGRGFAHSEYPRGNETVRGYLVWIKIPVESADTPIIFREVHGKDVKRTEKSAFTVTTIFGEGAPLETLTPAVFKHYVYRKDSRDSFELATGWNGFVYVSTGRVKIGELALEGGEGAVIEPGNDIEMEIAAGTELVKIKGRMLGEEIVQEGHYVR
ncbi:MAG: pirin family protein [Thermoplasmatota archaeon]